MIRVVGVVINIEMREKIILKYKKFNIKKEMKKVKKIKEVVNDKIKDKIKDVD